MSVSMGPDTERKSNLPDTVKLTADGGRYYRAMAFWYAFTALSIVPIVLLLIVAILNPFWFRDGFFRWCERTVNSMAKWRNYRQYALYLGCDPEYWHTLKG